MFSQTAEYALRALSCLALTPGDLVPTPSLAKQAGVPPNYLSKILQQLAAVGLVVGRRGVGGGYRLAKSASDISLVEIVGAVDRIERLRKCPLGQRKGDLCPLHRVSDRATAAALSVLESTTLQDLMNDVQAGSPLCSQDQPSLAAAAGMAT